MRPPRWRPALPLPGRQFPRSFRQFMCSPQTDPQLQIASRGSSMRKTFAQKFSARKKMWAVFCVAVGLVGSAVTAVEVIRSFSDATLPAPCERQDLPPSAAKGRGTCCDPHQFNGRRDERHPAQCMDRRGEPSDGHFLCALSPTAASDSEPSATSPTAARFHASLAEIVAAPWTVEGSAVDVASAPLSKLGRPSGLCARFTTPFVELPGGKTTGATKACCRGSE